MRFGLKEILKKAAAYCARQERSHYEVKEKLAKWGVFGEEAESVIVELITGNYLNEQRFAEAYAIGKFRQNGWGKRKIRLGLKRKRVPETCIDQALESIPQDEYVDGLRRIALKRAKGEKALVGFKAKQKVINYLISRGYEPSLARALMDEDDPFS